jgi:hypothetical protein
MLAAGRLRRGYLLDRGRLGGRGAATEGVPARQGVPRWPRGGHGGGTCSTGGASVAAGRPPLNGLSGFSLRDPGDCPRECSGADPRSQARHRLRRARPSDGPIALRARSNGTIGSCAWRSGDARERCRGRQRPGDRAATREGGRAEGHAARRGPESAAGARDPWPEGRGDAGCPRRSARAQRDDGGPRADLRGHLAPAVRGRGRARMLPKGRWSGAGPPDQGEPSGGANCGPMRGGAMAVARVAWSVVQRAASGGGAATAGTGQTVAHPATMRGPSA